MLKDKTPIENSLTGRISLRLVVRLSRLSQNF